MPGLRRLNMPFNIFCNHLKPVSKPFEGDLFYLMIVCFLSRNCLRVFSRQFPTWRLVYLNLSTHMLWQ